LYDYKGTKTKENSAMSHSYTPVLDPRDTSAIVDAFLQGHPGVVANTPATREALWMFLDGARKIGKTGLVPFFPRKSLVNRTMRALASASVPQMTERA
jgi:hypothetical protein